MTNVTTYYGKLFDLMSDGHSAFGSSAFIGFFGQRAQKHPNLTTVVAIFSHFTVHNL